MKREIEIMKEGNWRDMEREEAYENARKKTQTDTERN